MGGPGSRDIDHVILDHMTQLMLHLRRRRITNTTTSFPVRLPYLYCLLILPIQPRKILRSLEECSRIRRIHSDQARNVKYSPGTRRFSYRRRQEHSRFSALPSKKLSYGGEPICCSPKTLCSLRGSAVEVCFSSEGLHSGQYSSVSRSAVHEGIHCM